MVSFALYHPQMAMPQLGKDFGAEYTRRTRNEPNRLIYQAGDSLLLVVEAIKQAKSTEPAAIIKALQTMKFEGVRGAFQFSKEPGYSFQQWVEIPYVTYQLTEVNQPISKSNLVQPAGQKVDLSKLKKPAK